MALSLAVVLLATAGAAAAGGLMARRHRPTVERSWRALAAAVPDERATGAMAYRDDPTASEALAPHSRVALDLSPTSTKIWRAQEWVGALAGPLTALTLGLLPVAGIGPWSAVLGALLGTAMGATVLTDRRGLLTALGAVSLMLIPFTAWGWLAGLLTFTACRVVLDLKDAAGREEADIERLADARYLAGSRELRAALVARSRNKGGGDITAASARDNSRA